MFPMLTRRRFLESLRRFPINPSLAQMPFSWLERSADFWGRWMFCSMKQAPPWGQPGVLQTKQALHAAGLLHAGDTEPIHIYAGTGNLSGLTLFSPKATRIIAGRDITDIAFYLQNVSPNDVSVVSAGRDLVAYDPNSPLRSAAQNGSNVLSPENTSPLAGDIQI